MRIFLTAIFISLLVFSFPATAQELKENEVVVIKGEKYVMHQVRTGETVYSISKRYQIEQTELQKNNPKVADGLKIGDVLRIPYREGTDLTQNVADQKGAPDGFKNHKVKSRKETPYYIAQLYGITVEELLEYNKKSKKFKKGTSVKIPYWTPKPEPEIVDPIEDVTIQDAPVVTLPEEKKVIAYFEHIIESGETMWGTTRKYNVSEADLKELNPILNTGFPAGAVIKIPVKEVERTLAKPVNEDAFQKHYVEKGETLYGLSKKYDLSIPDIKKYNPILNKRGLVYGETILIPQKPDEIFQQIVENNKVDSARLVEEYYEVELPVEIPESCLPDYTGMYNNKTFTIALFLPLFLEANDTLNREDLVIDSMDLFTEEEVEIARDTTIEMEERKELFKQFYGGSENFIQFYEGVLLAVDTLQRAGVEVNLNVYDTQRNVDSVRKVVYDEQFLQNDLIIGPIYPNLQTDVAQLAAKNRIPMVSPLASQTNITQANPRYFQVNPSREYIAVRTAEMVAEEYYNSNFIIVKNGDYEGTPEGRLVELFREKFVNSGFMSSRNGVNFTIYDFGKEGSWGLRRIMSKHKENVVYVPSSDEGKLSVAISNVNNLAREYSITLIGSSRFPNYSSIQIDHYHNLKLKFIAPYWTNYTNPVTIDFVERFKEEFGTEPNNFGMQGYDVTMYFMTALTSLGPDFTNCLPYLHIDQVQGNYHFEKLTQFGGFMNNGVSVVSYSRDYEVERKRTKGQPRLMVEK